MSTQPGRVVRIPVALAHIEGMLALPQPARGVVLFVHGSGSSRHSPRNNFVAQALREVRCPTLLLVGGDDDVVIELNRQAQAELRCEKTLSIIPGATHLFEEPGTLEEVARQTAAWFDRYLLPASAPG